MTDKVDLDRFVQAQNPVLAQVLAELREGQKRSHWMWFVFPQLRGLGQSAMALHYGLASLAEATAYLEHPLLGRRLVDCVQLVNKVNDRSIHQIFGSPDDKKFHSSMTLFAAAAPNNTVFGAALDKYFIGMPDVGTIDRLRRS